MPNAKDGKAQVNVAFPEEDHHRLKVASVLRRRSIASVVREAVDEWLEAAEELDFLEGRSRSN